VKIKDIINEQGFWSNFGKALLPKSIKTAIDPDDLPINYLEKELANLAYKKFGGAPGLEDFKELGWLQPERFSRLVTPKPNEVDAKKLAKLAKQTRDIAKKEITKQKQPQTKSSSMPASDSASASASNIPTGQRLAVTNPQRNATFYKYPDGRWTDEFGTVMPAGSHGALDQFADAGGRIESIPTSGKSAYQSRGGRRGR